MQFLFLIVKYTNCLTDYFPYMYFLKQYNQIVCEYFLLKVEYAMFNICTVLLNYDFAKILLLGSYRSFTGWMCVYFSK